MTMFAFFWFASVFELMYFYGAPVPPSALPPHLDLAAGALAFAVEGVLFLWHLDGRNKLDVQVGKLKRRLWHIDLSLHGLQCAKCEAFIIKRCCVA